MKTNVDFSRFKKLSEDKKSATFQHPDGHKITVAKHVLSPGMRGELSKIPVQKLAPGGEVSSSEDTSTDSPSSPQAPVTINIGSPGANASYQPDTSAAPQEAPKDSGNSYDWKKNLFGTGAADQSDQYDLSRTLNDPKATTEQKLAILKNVDAEQTAQQNYQMQKQQQDAQTNAQYNQLAQKYGIAPPSQASPQMQAPAQIIPPEVAGGTPDNQPTSPQQNDQFGTQAYMDAYSKGLNEQKSGIQGMANAESQASQAAAPLLQGLADQQQHQVQSYQNHYNQLDQERQMFQHDLMNQHMDPNRFLKNMGTGQKVSMGIGLILGGIGSALTHNGGNPALDMMNKAIDNDVKSQEVDIHKGENLLSANMRQFGNLRDATDMTKIMQTDIVKNQIAAAAQRSNDPLVQARARAAIGQLDMAAAPVMSQMAMRKTMMGQMNQGQNQDPASKIRVLGMMGVINPQQQQAAMKELGTAEELSKAKDNALGVFDKLNGQNTIANRILSPIQTSREVQSARDNIAVQIARDEAGRVNEYEFKAAQNLFPAPGDNAKTLASKRQDLINAISKKMNTPTLNSLGINLNNSGRFNAQGQKKIQLGAPVAP